MEKSFALYLNKPNLFNHLNEEMLVQKYIRGPELHADAITLESEKYAIEKTFLHFIV